MNFGWMREWVINMWRAKLVRKEREGKERQRGSMVISPIRFHVIHEKKSSSLICLLTTRCPTFIKFPNLTWPTIEQFGGELQESMNLFLANQGVWSLILEVVYWLFPNNSYSYLFFYLVKFYYYNKIFLFSFFMLKSKTGEPNITGVKSY